MPSPTLRTVLQTTSLLASTILVALSAATVYLTTSYTASIGFRVPQGVRTWYGLINSPERRAYWAAVDAGSNDFDQVVLEYVNSNDIWILVSGCVGLAAGIMGWLAVYWTAKKEKNPTATRPGFPRMLASTIFFGTAALAMALTSTIMTSQTKTRLQSSTCIPNSAYTPANNYFVCTRELAACHIFENVYMQDMDWSQRMCNEAKASRKMLIPTLVCAVVLIGVWVAQAFVSRKRGAAVAEMRVKNLQQDEAWENSTA